MTDNQPADLDREIATVLTHMAKSYKQDRHATEAYRRMESSETIGQVVRQLHHAASQSVMDAFDVLKDKFGFDGSHELYGYLHTVPYRWKLYEEEFNAETHVGCVDRTVARIASEIRTAGGLQPATPLPDPRFQAAALAKDADGDAIGETAAANALVLADQFDHARRIQRLSCDTRTITERIIADGASGVTPEQVRGLVRLVLTTASAVAHDVDGLEP